MYKDVQLFCSMSFSPLYSSPPIWLPIELYCCIMRSLPPSLSADIWEPVNLKQARLCSPLLMAQYAPCYSRIIDAKSLAIKSVLLKLIGSVGSQLICALGTRERVLGLVGSLARNSLIMVHVTLEPHKPRISISKPI